MTLARLDAALAEELRQLAAEGRAKPPERVITGYLPAKGERGPRYTLAGEEGEFLRCNSNSYLSLAHHPQVVAAADAATHALGVGPGAVRFIDGTYSYHVLLEQRIAEFLGLPAAKIFNSAYTANCGLALAISSPTTCWLGDALNHNSIIRAMRIAGVPRQHKAIYAHNDVADLRRCLDQVPAEIERAVVIFDGVFSMRGDNAPIADILATCRQYEHRFPQGLVTVVDDSHGIGAYGETGRGTPEYCGAWPDIVIGTFGKGFGVNGGFIAASPTVIEAVRQKADTYIYTNPLSVADCAAATEAITLCDSDEGRGLLANLSERTRQLRNGLASLGLESIAGPHPVVPLLIQDTGRTRELVQQLFNQRILVVGLTFPVVPRGDESIRMQVNAAHTRYDIDYLLDSLGRLLG